ncbi:MAG TPA: hypothetical protein VHA78_03280, partial [Candidatus Peribacteraceae bacterium]|nr:hypothetical protein [Candidatus Peribacteraceae bacterium]
MADDQTQQGDQGGTPPPRPGDQVPEGGLDPSQVFASPPSPPQQQPQGGGTGMGDDDSSATPPQDMGPPPPPVGT